MKVMKLMALVVLLAFGLFLVTGVTENAYSQQQRLQTLKNAENICLNEEHAEDMSSYCDLVYGYLRETNLSKEGVRGKRILIGRCDFDSDCPQNSQCSQGRCYQNVLNKETCMSDFECSEGKKCINSLCTQNP